MILRGSLDGSPFFLFSLVLLFLLQYPSVRSAGLLSTFACEVLLMSLTSLFPFLSLLSCLLFLDQYIHPFSLTKLNLIMHDSS